MGQFAKLRGETVVGWRELRGIKCYGIGTHGGTATQVAQEAALILVSVVITYERWVLRIVFSQKTLQMILKGGWRLEERLIDHDTLPRFEITFQ